MSNIPPVPDTLIEKFYHDRSVKLLEEMESIGQAMIDINNL